MPAALAIRQPGYDGAHFAEEPVRDFDGKGKRDLVRRVRYDVIEMLYQKKVGPKPAPGYTDNRKGLIELYQRDAAIELQVDDQLASTPVMARPGNVGGGQRHDFGIADAILAARGRARACEKAMGLQWPIIQAVVLTNLNLTKAAAVFGIDRLRVLPRLRAALDCLSDFYGTR